MRREWTDGLGKLCDSPPTQNTQETQIFIFQRQIYLSFPLTERSDLRHTSARRERYALVAQPNQLAHYIHLMVM